MSENKLFDSIDNQHYPEVKKMFEQEIINIQNKNLNLELVDLNKKFLSTIVINLDKFKKPVIFTHTAAELQLKKQKVFENTLSKKEEEFNSLMTSHLPSENIDFSDEMDRPFEDDIDKLINNTLKDRQLELEKIMKTQTNSVDQANSWISNNNPQSNNNINIGESLENNILSNNITNLSNIDDYNKQEKNVKFNLNISEQNINEDNLNLDKKINLLLDKQDKMMNILNTIVNKLNDKV